MNRLALPFPGIHLILKLIANEVAMTIEEARDLLVHYNAWRRDDHIPNSHSMPNPKEIGIAIDIAISVLDAQIHSSDNK